MTVIMNGVCCDKMEFAIDVGDMKYFGPDGDDDGSWFMDIARDLSEISFCPWCGMRLDQ
jgi:hypothetical protein